jgi:hypothetical protein
MAASKLRGIGTSALRSEQGDGNERGTNDGGH